MQQQKRIEASRQRRRRRVRNKIEGTLERPRLSVHRSSKHIYAQLIDDTTGNTLVAVGSAGKTMEKDVPYGGNIKAAKVIGKKIAELAAAKGIKLAAFDRGHYRFHGRIKALALAANEAGLKCTEHKPGKKIKEEPPKPEKPAKGEKAPKGEKPAKGEKGEKPKKEKAPAAKAEGGEK